MPRVSQEYLERRRQHILDAARRCFARNGFHETSMQDVFRESGLSAGAVYRYFKSKDDLIQEIAAQAYGRIASVVDGALAQDPFPGIDEILGTLAVAAAELSGPDGPTRIAVTAWEAALHDPDMAVVVGDVLKRFRQSWTKVAWRLHDEGRLEPGVDPEAVGAALFALMPGFLLQQLLLGDVDAAMFRSAVRALMRPQLLSPGAAAGCIPGRRAVSSP
jgi:AcrR family transcriptional regulator